MYKVDQRALRGGRCKSGYTPYIVENESVDEIELQQGAGSAGTGAGVSAPPPLMPIRPGLVPDASVAPQPRVAQVGEGASMLSGIGWYWYF